MKDVLNAIIDDFSIDDAQRVKDVEAKTNHDVKAVEYLLRQKLEGVPGGTRQLRGVHPLRVHVGRHQQPRVRADAARRAAARAAAVHEAAQHRPAHARAPFRRCADARTHARSAGHADHARQGDRELRLPPRAASRPVRERHDRRQIQRRGGQLQRARGCLPRRRLARDQPPLPRVTRAHADARTPRRSSRTTGSPSTARRCRASTRC